MSNSTLPSNVDFNGRLYSVYDAADKLVLNTPDQAEALALSQKLKEGFTPSFNEDGLR